MLIKELFVRDIFRDINGVVKAGQLDYSSVWQELDEFVITRELDQHFRKFFSWYLDAADQGKKADPTGKMGVWIWGFYGSGKSHLLKVLSYLLRNDNHSNNGSSKKAVEFFDSKVKDPMLFADIKRAVSANTDVILFNIDSKADNRGGRDLILRVFIRVLNELQGFSGDHPHIAHMERYLQRQGKLELFHQCFEKHKGSTWLEERDDYQSVDDEITKSLNETLGQSLGAAKKWLEGAEENFALSVENFCKWVKQYLDSKGSSHRIIFLVDEVGQFIGADSQLMLNLQTIIEELGTICKRKAWVVVTSQEDMDGVLGDMGKVEKQDFSKIQGRFYPPLSLSSANVDEVIQSRLLEKIPDSVSLLEEMYNKCKDILKNQLSFTNCGMTFRHYKDTTDFVRNYPFAPYQFQLVQKVFESIRKAGATGAHLARGERSMLDAFQSAAKTNSAKAIGMLVPLYDFYPCIQSFLDTTVKKTIDQAESNPSLQPFDNLILQVLFLIRYVEEMKGNVDNLVTLCLDQIDADRLALRRRIEDSLARLEKETLVSRSGENYLFLTNEERDINKEIKQVSLSNGDEAKLVGEILFSDVLKDMRKHRFSANKVDFEFNRLCDLFPVGNQKAGSLIVSVITPLADDYESYDTGKALLDSGMEGGRILIKLENDESLGREIRICLQTEKFTSRKNDGTLLESTKRILRSFAEENRIRRERMTLLLGNLLAEGSYFVNGQVLKIQASNPKDVLEEALEYLIQNTFSKMNYLKKLLADPLPEMQAILRGNDSLREKLLFEKGENNPDAINDLRSYLQLAAQNSKQVVLHDLLEKRYALRPYGWPENEILLLLARLLVLGEITLVMDGATIPLDKIYEAINTPAKRRKIFILKRVSTDAGEIQKARMLGKDLFAEMGPDGEDPLFNFLQARLLGWHDSLKGFKQLADTGKYPGKNEISQGLTLITPLLADKESKKFIDRFNSLKNDLLKLSDEFTNLKNFYNIQKTVWEKLDTAYSSFQLNRLELQKDSKAGQALQRMQQILAADSPYKIINEADGLIGTVEKVNSELLDAHKAQTLTKLENHIATITKDLKDAKADSDLNAACLNPLKTLKEYLQKEKSLAHVTQSESEALKEFDAAVAKIEAWVNRIPPDPVIDGRDDDEVDPPPPPTPPKRQKVIKPAHFMKSAYLETKEEVRGFLEILRKELEQAIDSNERIQIR
jgi:hypothetical protein